MFALFHRKQNPTTHSESDETSLHSGKSNEGKNNNNLKLAFGANIGQGNFSRVFKGTYKGKIPVAIKVIDRGSEKVVKSEIKILNRLKGSPHTIQLLDVIKDDKEKDGRTTTTLVFDYINSLNIESLLDPKIMTFEHFRFYLQCILGSLSFAHKKKIIHRDIRINNIMVKNDFSDVVLIDWGCGTFVSNDMKPSAGARSVRSPEMLLGFKKFGKKGDIWAVGVLIVYFLTGGNVPWKCDDCNHTLYRLFKYFGGEREILKLERNLNLHKDSEYKYIPFNDLKNNDQISEEKKSLEKEFLPIFEHLQTKELIDLMNQCLTIDYRKRPSASHLLKHPFFNNTAKST